MPKWFHQVQCLCLLSLGTTLNFPRICHAPWTVRRQDLRRYRGIGYPAFNTVGPHTGRVRYTIQRPFIDHDLPFWEQDNSKLPLLRPSNQSLLLPVLPFTTYA